MKKIINKDGTITLNLTSKELEMLDIGLGSMIGDLAYTIDSPYTEDCIAEDAEKEMNDYIKLREQL